MNLKERIISAESFLHSGVIISSPANKNIVYKLEQAFEIIVTHEERHLNQAIAIQEAQMAYRN